MLMLLALEGANSDAKAEGNSQLPFETIVFISPMSGLMGWNTVFTLEEANAVWMCITEACGSQPIGGDLKRDLERNQQISNLEI